MKEIILKSFLFLMIILSIAPTTHGMGRKSRFKKFDQSQTGQSIIASQLQDLQNEFETAKLDYNGKKAAFNLGDDDSQYLPRLHSLSGHLSKMEKKIKRFEKKLGTLNEPFSDFYLWFYGQKNWVRDEKKEVTWRKKAKPLRNPEVLEDDATCAICLENLKEKIDQQETVVEMNCGARNNGGHFYCEGCTYSQYCTNNPPSNFKCPLCRRNIRDHQVNTNGPISRLTHILRHCFFSN